jgi:recombination protein RecA
MNIGEASILNLLLAHATRSDHYCALVDVSGVFDAQFAAEIGAEMEKLLWVRCGGARTKEYERERLALLSRPMSMELMMAGSLSSNLLRGGDVIGSLTALTEHGLTEQKIKKAVQSVSETGAVMVQQKMLAGGSNRLLTVELIDPSKELSRRMRASGSLGRSSISMGRAGQMNRLDLKQEMKPLEKAFKAADILLQNGGFGLIAVDLSGVDERLLRKVPKATWFRFSRVAEKTQTALVFLASYPAAGNCSVWTLRMKGMRTVWSGSAGAPHTNILADVSFGAEVTRSYRRGKAEFPRVFKAPAKMPVASIKSLNGHGVGRVQNL